MYTVSKVILDKLEIKGYEIKSNAVSKLVSLHEIIKMAEKGDVENISVIDGTVCFKHGMQGIDWVTQYNNKHFTILSRLVNKDNICIGYKVKDENGKVLKISLNKAWELAILHTITNVEANVISGIKSIVGVGDLRLSELVKERC